MNSQNPYLLFLVFFLFFCNDSFAQLDTIKINLDELIISDTGLVIHYDLPKHLFENRVGQTYHVPIQTYTEDSSASYYIPSIKTYNTIIRRLSQPKAIGRKSFSQLEENWHLFILVGAIQTYPVTHYTPLQIQLIRLSDGFERKTTVNIQYHIVDD